MFPPVPSAGTVARRPRLELAFLTLVMLGLLLPFLGKALNIDDPIYVWIARQIVEHPFDAYGFAVNWRGEALPLHAFVNNPPLASYYLALAGSLGGWSEHSLHAAFLLPALAVVWATWALSRRFGANGLTGALLLGLAPAFLVSSTTLMADVPMLALWIGAFVCWDRGLRGNERPALLAGAVLAGLCALTKFPGLALLPLLVAHALLLRIAWHRWAPWLLIPLATFGAYLAYTDALYGHALFLDPIAYAGNYRPEGTLDVLGRVLCGLAFTGAGAASLLAVAPLLVDRPSAAGFGVLALSLALGMTLAPGIVSESLQAPTTLGTAVVFQLALWSSVGVGVLALAVTDALKTRAPESIVLLLWVFGIFVFAALLNWTVNVRSILPLVPAAAILAARRIARREPKPRHAGVWLAAGLTAAAVLSLTVARADEQLAASARNAARDLVDEYGGANRDVWFQGHWGFQYYAQARGAKPLQRGKHLPAGAILLAPRNNSYLWPLNATRLAERTFEGPTGCATMDSGTGAGFYASTWGPMPFAFGAVSPETYAVYESPGAASSPAPTSTRTKALVRK